MVAKCAEVCHIASTDFRDFSLVRPIFLFIASHFLSGGAHFFFGSKFGISCSSTFLARQKLFLKI